jgi:hypothetical protein
MSETATGKRRGATASGIPTGPLDGSGSRDGAAPEFSGERVAVERAALLLSVLIAVAVPTVTALNINFPGRAVLAVLFALTVPGVPGALLLRVRPPLLAWSLAVALSIAAALLTATAALLTRWWSPLGWSVLLAAVDVAGTGYALVRLRRLPVATRRFPRATAPMARTRVLSAVALAGAVALWWLSVRSTSLDTAGATGVIGVIGWAYVAALVILAAVVSMQLLRHRPDGVVLAAAALLLTLFLFGYVNLTDGEASVPAGWLHVGFAGFITDHHASFSGLDARADWPAFFAAAATLAKLGGVADASTFLSLAPVFYNAAAIAPLLVIARCVTRSRRTAWLAVFIYLGANWFQQDYFSPQATVFLLYLTTLATLLWLARAATVAPLEGGRVARVASAWRRMPPPPAGTTRGQALAVEAALVVLGAAIVASHQLTPVALMITTLLFVVTGYTRYRRLWLIVSLLFLGWFSYAATDFWSGHLSTVFGDLGRLGANFNSGVASRVTGNPTYQLMQNVRLGWSLLYLLLALIGFWSIRRRPDALLLGLLVASTGSLVALQSYGGEVVLRVFVYAGPLLAPLAALALRRLVTRRNMFLAPVLTVVIALAALLGTATRGVNVAFERVTPDDVAAAHVVWAHVRPGDTLGYVYPSGAYSGGSFGRWTGLDLGEQCTGPLLQCAIDRAPTFLLLSRSQDAALQLLASARPGSVTGLAGPLVARGLYKVLYNGEDAEVLQLIPQ